MNQKCCDGADLLSLVRLAETNSFVLSRDLNVPEIPAGVVFAESLFQRVGTATRKERDNNNNIRQ